MPEMGYAGRSVLVFGAAGASGARRAASPGAHLVSGAAIGQKA